MSKTKIFKVTEKSFNSYYFAATNPSSFLEDFYDEGAKVEVVELMGEELNQRFYKAATDYDENDSVCSFKDYLNEDLSDIDYIEICNESELEIEITLVEVVCNKCGQTFKTEALCQETTETTCYRLDCRQKLFNPTGLIQTGNQEDYPPF